MELKSGRRTTNTGYIVLYLLAFVLSVALPAVVIYAVYLAVR